MAQSNSTSNRLMARIQSTALQVLPDTDRYKVRFDVPSSSSNRVHRISYDNASGAQYWTCSCRGNIRWGSCRHLEALGLKGRKFGRQSLESYIPGIIA